MKMMKNFILKDKTFSFIHYSTHGDIIFIWVGYNGKWKDVKYSTRLC